MAVLKLLNVVYTAADVGRSRAFYESVMGLRVKFQDGERWAQLDACGAALAISGPPETESSGLHGPAMTLEVDDLGADLKRLESLGISVSAVRDMGDHGKSASVLDPDGNVVLLFQRPAKMPASP